jgi:aminoglycoside phosphotransferase (APT) family kinase protein
VAFTRISLIAAASRLLGEPAEFVRSLPGGTHAEIAVIAAGERELVVRRFPPGDDAVAREIEVLSRIGALGSLVPQLVAHRLDHDALIITTKVDGDPPDPALIPGAIAAEMARMLARLHSLDPAGLPHTSRGPLRGETLIARTARANPPDQDPIRHVLVHSDFWCGNALWRGARLTGLVDWSGAHAGARGLDVAWCRQDLVLLGAPDAADIFLREYEQASGTEIDDLWAWDLSAGAWADPVVETWAPNYAGIGRADLTPDVIRNRLNDWNAALVRGGR